MPLPLVCGPHDQAPVIDRDDESPAARPRRAGRRRLLGGHAALGAAFDSFDAAIPKR